MRASGLIISFFCYFSTVLGLVGFGLAYLVTNRFMPYHQAAVGKPWDAVEPAYQILVLALMRAAGAGFLSVALAMLVLLLVPFRRGEPWARWAIPFIGFSILVPLLIVVATVRMSTAASPPVGLLVCGLLLVTTGVAFSLVDLPRAKKTGDGARGMTAQGEV